MNEQTLTPERKEELLSAFNGANSLALLFVYLILTALPIWWISDKMTGWAQLSGLVLLSLFTAFILMLFLTGLIKALLKMVFSSSSSEYRVLFSDTNKKS
jgi:hypothetical protein